MGGTAHPRVAFRVLGPVEAVVEGRTIALGSPKVRQLLAALLVNANSVVSSDRLVEILWGESAPMDVSGALQKNVHRLRSLLKATPGPTTDDADVLATRAPGYVLAVDAESYDAARLEELVAEAQRRSERGDPRAALDALDDALALWRGAAFAEFASDDFARTEATRLEELRVTAIEERVEALLALGRHDEVTGELDALVAEYPYRERLWGQLMLALYRSGRQADALRAFSRVRALLGEELGIDPGASLRDLEEAILLQKPELDWVPSPTPLGGGTPRAPSRPALPTELARDDLLVGRGTELAWLDDLLARAEQGPVGARLRGESGSGRTTLVAAFGRRAFDQGCAVLYTTAPTGTSTGAWSGLQPMLDEVTVLCEVARSTAKPVVLIVDDVHRAEPETVAVLERLVQSPEPGPLLLVTTTAGSAKTVVPNCWSECTLAPFGEGDVAALLEARLDNAPSPGLAAAVLEETGGNARRVDDVATRLAEAELDERVARAVARAAVAQRDLRTMQHEIATSVGERSRRAGPARAGAEPADADGAVACPYKGLAPFDAADAEFFCGRDRLVDELVARLAVARFVAVIGPSGSGKSSLVRAGLVPALARGALPGSREWRTLMLRPGDAFAIPADGHVTLVVDQLEELFTTDRDERARAAFLNAFARGDGVEGRATVVVAFRGDSLDRFAAFTPFARLVGESQLLVGPMSDAEVHAAIEEPARRAGLTLEDGLADAIAAGVAGQPGALPLLSTALLETWVRRRGRTLTHAGYHEAGGVAGAVARLAEDTYARFTPDEQLVCRRLLLRLTEPGAGREDVRRRVPLAEITEAGDVTEARVLETLVARRLVTAGDGTAEVAHEALLREWPRLRGWLEEDRDGRRIHRRVAAAAIEWDAGGRDATELYHGTRLDAALDWSAAHPGDANPLEREFLASGGAAHDHELRTARRTARRLRSLTIGLAVLLVVALVAGTVALVQRGNANQQASRANDAATLARATQLATEARTLPATQNDLALLLGVEGRRLQPSPTTDGGLEAAIVHRPPGLERVVHFGTPAAYASLSDDGRFVVAPGNDGNIRIYDFATGRLLRTLRGTHDPPFVAFFNSDDSLIVTGGIHGKITIWRVATGKPIGPPIRAGGQVVYGVFSGGTGLYTVSDTGVFAQWDFRDPKRPRLVGELFRFPLGQNEVPVAAFGGGPDRNIMAAGGSVSLPTTIFDVATHRHIADVVGTPGNFSPDGTLLATSLADHVVLWDAATGAERRDLSLGNHPVAPGSGGFSPDGRFLTATDQDDNAIRVFDIASGQQVGQPLQVPSSFAFGGSLLPGNRMVTIDADEAAIWQLDAHVPLLETVLDDHTGGPPGTENGAFGQFTPDGAETITVGVSDKRVLAFDATSGKARGDPLKGRETTEFPLAFSPDGKIIASGNTPEGGFTLWDRASGRELSHVDTGVASGTMVAWDPHRPILVTSDFPHFVRFWDVSDPRHPVGRRSVTAPAGLVWYSPDGRLVAIADGFKKYTATVLDAATGKKLFSFGGGRNLSEISFSPDSRTLAAGIAEINGGKVVLYDTTSWHVRTLTLPYVANGVAFVDGGARFVTSSYLFNGRVDLWDTATLQPVGEHFTLTTADNFSAIANALGTKVAFGSFNGLTHVLDVSPSSWQRTACRLAGRNLTRAEWAQYFPGQAYRSTCARWPAGP